jgi:hypothetical protein
MLRPAYERIPFHLTVYPVFAFMSKSHPLATSNSPEWVTTFVTQQYSKGFSERGTLGVAFEMISDSGTQVLGTVGLPSLVRGNTDIQQCPSLGDRATFSWGNSRYFTEIPGIYSASRGNRRWI